MEAAGQTALLLVWDNASWPISQEVRAWLAANAGRERYRDVGERGHGLEGQRAAGLDRAQTKAVDDRTARIVFQQPRVTQLVDGTKGVHAMIPKSIFLK